MLLVIFIDLAGFSIIFPLFPAMLDHYLAREGPDSVIGHLAAFLNSFSRTGESTLFLTAVLFGGILGSLYSLLQFISSPFWGRLSDRYGRRRILLFTATGTALSYFLWMFSGAFILLLIARALGGLMAGNIAVATAAVADLSSKEQRSRSMALVGLAFGLGFVVGPAIGGFSTLIAPELFAESSAAIGFHPFTLAAAFAFLLSLINLIWLYTRFPETLSERQLTAARANPLPPSWLPRTGNPAVRHTSRLYFIILLAFSGMEFTLTFLAVERLFYDPAEMVKVFLFVGFWLALAQGFIVRRFIRRTGEIPMAMSGILCAFLGLILLASAYAPLVFYAGLAALAIGIGLTSPTLTALVSLYSSAMEQGHNLGVFRAYGALARAAGPLACALLYWYYGSSTAYLAGAAILISSMGLALVLPKPYIPAEGEDSKTGA